MSCEKYFINYFLISHIYIYIFLIYIYIYIYIYVCVCVYGVIVIIIESGHYVEKYVFCKIKAVYYELMKLSKYTYIYIYIYIY